MMMHPSGEAPATLGRFGLAGLVFTALAMLAACTNGEPEASDPVTEQSATDEVADGDSDGGSDETTAGILDLAGRIFAYSDPDSNSGFLVRET